MAGGFRGIVDKPDDDFTSRGGKAGTANTSVCAELVARKLALWSSMQVET